MNWNEYKALAIRTESVPINTFEKVPYNIEAHKPGDILSANKNATRLLHAVMGICTELAELEDGQGNVNFVEEVGDVLWYLAIADDVINWQMHNRVYEYKSNLFWLGELNDAMKRHLFYGTELNIDKLIDACIAIYRGLIVFLSNRKFVVEKAMEANIRKLEKRYPDKYFDAKAAVHRDTDRELDHIMENGELIPKVETLLELSQEEQAEVEDLDAESFTKLIFTNLTASQISALAMDMCFEMAAILRQVGATMEARGYDMLYSQCGDFAKDPNDYSLYNMWATLEYPTTKGEVSELLERWK